MFTASQIEFLKEAATHYRNHIWNVCHHEYSGVKELQRVHKLLLEETVAEYDKICSKLDGLKSQLQREEEKNNDYK